MTVDELSVDICGSVRDALPQPLFDDPAALYAVCGRCSPKGLSLNMIDERSGMSSAVEPPLDATSGSAEASLAFMSSRAAIRLDLARSLAQCTMLTPENSEIRQQEKMMAAMFPLRFHSAISPLEVLVAEAAVVIVEELVVVIVELLKDVEVELVVDWVEVDELELVVEVEVEVDDAVVELEVVDVDVVVVSEKLVLVDVSELVLEVVVDVVDSEVVDVSRATIMTRSISSRTPKTFRLPSALAAESSCPLFAVFDSSEEIIEAPYGWHAINAKCDASSRTAVLRILVILNTSYLERVKQSEKV